MATNPKDDMRTAATASEDAIHALFGDDFRAARAAAAAIDRVNELMRPGLNAETLANGRVNDLLTTKKRHRPDIYECVSCGTQFQQDVECPSCGSADMRLFMRAPPAGSFPGSDKEAWLTEQDPDWRERFGDVERALDFYQPDPTPAPRMRLVNGGGGVEPAEFEPAPYRDPDSE